MSFMHIVLLAARHSRFTQAPADSPEGGARRHRSGRPADAGKEVCGKADLKVVRNQFQYLFATPESKATFEKSPEKYEIQLGGVCARMGGGVTGNPVRLRRRGRQDLHLRQRRLPQEVRRRAREVPAQARAADARRPRRP